MSTTSYEQLAADNESLRGGVVNAAAGSLPLAPYTMVHGFFALLAIVVSIFAYFLVGVETAGCIFVVVLVSLMVWGGNDTALELEKMKKTREFFGELPLKETGNDGLPRPSFRTEPYITRKDQRYYSIEQKFNHLRFYGSYEKNLSNAGFYYQQHGTSPNVYLVFGFKVQGYSPCMDHVDCMQAMKQINRSFRNYPDLKLRFVWSVPSDGSAQILQQKELLEQAELDDLSVEIIKARGRWAVGQEREGKLVTPTLSVYARTQSALGQENAIPQNWKDKWTAKLTPQIEKMFGDEPEQALAIRAIDFAFDSCCTTTMRAFNGELNLRARPLTVHELFQLDYAELHDSPVDECPQYVRVTDAGLFEHTSSESPHHILGDIFREEARSAVPVFYRDKVWFPSKGKKDSDGNPTGLYGACIRLGQMESYSGIRGSHAVGHIQNTVRWFEGLSDVKLITEAEAINPLRRKRDIDKAITNRTKRVNAAVARQNPDMDSMDDIDDLYDARQMFRAGDRVLSVCTLVWVYAEDADKLSLKVTQVTNRIGLDNCVLVQNAIEQHWVDSQPYTWDAMCQDRRPEYMITQSVPLFPLAQPQPLDKKGVGFVGKHISAQYFIDFCQKKNHTLITAKSGGGKSMMGLEIMAQCIATGTPYMFLDSPPIADQSKGEVAKSTYSPAIEQWQSLDVDCAYQDVKKRNFNILGRYGLGRNTFEVDALVETHVDTLMAAVIGDNPKHELKEYVKSLLSLSYKDFAQKTIEADKDPILEDYLRHYTDWSETYLNGNADLTSIIGVQGIRRAEPTAREREAAGMISSQLIGVLGQSWGKRINAQTDFDENVKYLVLGLTDIRAGSKEGLVYALASLAFMNRITSKNPHSVFGMDEGSSILPMEAFAARFARIFTEGRKKGGNGILLTTELMTLLNSPYCSEIINNFDNILAGLCEEGSVDRLVETMGFKEELLRKYTQEPDLTTMTSQWYLKRGTQHLELVYHTTRMLLALGATHPHEILAKDHFITSSDPHGRLDQYGDFGRALYSAYKQGRGPLTLIR